MALSEEIRAKYKPVIGLEIHAQMLTKSKAYSSDKNEYGAQPNTLVSVLTLGHPGTLPRMNKKTIEYAVKMGVACECKISERQHFARKNYFYPDLPKGYQITQDTTPICTGGFVEIKDAEGSKKKIRLTRIHMEEDAGKSIHDIDPFNTLIDLNRAGVPLIEIVSEPDIASSQEAYNYVSEVRKLVRYLDICDGNMEEGSLRCDANISVMLNDAKDFGVKVEVKNMNSIRNVQRAIEYEIERQILAVESGEKIIQETRNFNALTGTTAAMRTKEAANDYRYFPEPDLQPIRVTTEYVAKVKEQMPPLPSQLFEKYTKQFGLSDYDAGVLTDQKEIALYYEKVVEHTSNFKSAANWVMGEVKGYLNSQALDIDEFNVTPIDLASLIKLIDENKISNSLASQKLFPAMIETSKNPLSLAEENGWIQTSDENALKEIVLSVFNENNSEYERLKNGESKLIGFIVGKVMQKSQGKADPKMTNKIINELISK